MTVTIEELRRRIEAELPAVQVDSAGDDLFFSIKESNAFPFATIVTKDNDFDNKGHLDRAGVYRLNIGIGRAAFQEVFPAEKLDEDEESDRLDYRALNVLLPHPVYAKAHWVGILSPSETMLQRYWPLIVSAHARSTARADR